MLRQLPIKLQLLRLAGLQSPHNWVCHMCLNLLQTWISGQGDTAKMGAPLQPVLMA